MVSVVSFGILLMQKKSEIAIYYEAVCVTSGSLQTWGKGEKFDSFIAWENRARYDKDDLGGG